MLSQTNSNPGSVSATLDSAQNLRQTVIRCRNVVKTYGSGNSAVRALRGVDIDVAAGELMMLVGPSGCGKTTLISIVAGVLDRDAGECSVLGVDYAKMSSSERAAFRGKNIGFVFQQFNLIPTLTIAENAAVPLLIGGIARKKAMAEATSLLAQFGLGERANDYPMRLSGGQQQRVAIARALVHRPRIIVCDEPTSALDHVTGQKVMELLRSVAARNDLSLVVVTHDQRIFEFADRIAEMDDGRIKHVNTGEGHARAAVTLVDDPAK